MNMPAPAELPIGVEGLRHRKANFLSRYPQAALLVATIVLLTAGAVWVARHDDVSNHAMLAGFYLGIAGMGAGFLLALRLRRISWPLFWLVAIGLRVAFFPMTPGPDVYRYVWEGHIQNQGFDPYSHAPDAAALEPLRDRVWERVEHKSVSAIYPPLAQLGFRILAAVSLSPSLFKAAFLLADLAVCLLLARRFGVTRSLLYAWNPLVIYSFAAGAHYDSWLLLCVTGAWLAWEKESRVACALLIGAAAAIKWITFPMMLWIAWRVASKGNWRRAIGFLCVAALPFFLVWPIVTRGHLTAPLIPSDFALHARSCELIPAIVSWIRPDRFWRNSIYLFPLAVLSLWLIARCPNFVRFAEGYLLLLLTLSPMVHAWYFTWLIPFAVFTRNVGTIAVSLTAFAYFGIPSMHEMLDRDPTLVGVQRAFIWLPLIAGFAWTRCGQGLSALSPPKERVFTKPP